MSELRPIEIMDERSPLSREAVALIRESIRDVGPAWTFLSEVRDRRQGRSTGGAHHLLALVSADDRVAAAATGIYLEGANAGFVNYLAVREEERGRGLGRELRRRLVEALRVDARESEGTDLAWVVGEVRRDSPWLRTLLRSSRVIPFDLAYFHPWLARSAEGHYVLYREPVGDHRTEIPVAEVARLLHIIWRRVYHTDDPHRRSTFRYMLEQLEGRETVGAADLGEILDREE